MKADKLKLTNFRNYEKREFEFADKTVIVGDNGSGKTNILEAIFLVATAKSFRADRDGEMVRYGEKMSNVECLMFNDQLRVYISDGGVPGVRKRFFVNEVAKRGMDFAGRLKAVMFSPTDLDLVTGSPSVRRKYLDFVLSQKDREYRINLGVYEKGLRQRNRLLGFIQEGTASRSQLYYWDKLLVKHGGYITDKRTEYLRKFNIQDSRLNTRDLRYNIVYDKSVISEDRLKQYEIQEVAAKSTLVGPHRDDFRVVTQFPIYNLQFPNNDQISNVQLNKPDVSKFGSRGEQRMAVMALKLWEREYLTQDSRFKIQDSISNVQYPINTNKYQLPILLLDDVFSELDHKHRDEILKLIDNQIERGGQVIMTTADEHLVPEGNDWTIIRL